jgi:hypothetical protein
MRADRDRDMVTAWQRAKVGDRVLWRYGQTETVSVVSRVDGTYPHLRVAVLDEITFPALGYRWVNNDDILSVLPPDPAAPVQDARENATMQALRRTQADQRALWTAILGGGPICRDCADQDGRCPSTNLPCDPQDACMEVVPKLLDALKPQPISIDWNTALDTYYATAQAPLGTASDGLMAVLRLIPGLVVEE